MQTLTMCEDMIPMWFSSSFLAWGNQWSNMYPQHMALWPSRGLHSFTFFTFVRMSRTSQGRLLFPSDPSESPVYANLNLFQTLTLEEYCFDICRNTETFQFSNVNLCISQNVKHHPKLWAGNLWLNIISDDALNEKSPPWTEVIYRHRNCL